MRKPRIDAPGLLHHVCNRGLAQRPIFETQPDIRFFFRRLKRVVALGELEVLAFVVMTNHFHMLVRSATGLSAAMKKIEQPFVQYFNRTRERDGPLFKGRFFSRPVRTHTDFRLVVRYIDDNPVAAGIVANPAEYPHGSAYWYARASGPPWLARTSLEIEVCGTNGDGYRPEAYARDFGWTFGPAQRAWVEHRMRHRFAEADSLDNLLAASVDEVREWLESRANVADRVRPKEVVLAPQTVIDETERQRKTQGPWPMQIARKRRCGWQIACSSLLRTAAGTPREEIAMLLSVTLGEARALAGAHRWAMQHQPIYANRIATMLHGALQRELLAARRMPI